MDQIIHTAAKGGFEHKLVYIGDENSSTKYYFFFRQELDVPSIASGNAAKDEQAYSNLKSTTLRHAIPNKGKIFDYIEGKHYKTLSEWALANGRSLEDIVYGVNHIHFGQNREQAWFTLDQLLKFLDEDWEWPTEIEEPKPDNTKFKKALLSQIETIEKTLIGMRSIVSAM